MNNNILNKFSNNFKNSLKAAGSLAMQLNHKKIEPEHIFYGLLQQKGSVGAELLNNAKIKSTSIKEIIVKINWQPPQNNLETKQATIKTIPRFSPEAKKVIQKSVQVAYINQHQYIGTEHLLTALLKCRDHNLVEIFQNIKIPKKILSKQVISILKNASRLPDITATFKAINQEQQKQGIKSRERSSQPSALDIFGQNLTDKKFQKKIDPVIGRELEISRIIQILSRRTKNNPILLGEPGVGKTAIIEGLAKKITQGDVPKALKDKKIYSIDLTATVAGTMYRGEFENRIKQIIEEARHRPEIILFIDEIHNIVGIGSASGSMDAANILKPALARGEIRCIGATTFNDFRKSIENDNALERRFQTVKIAEPSLASAEDILFGVKEYFEKFHQVTITDSAVKSAVELSQKYLPEKFLPDKAIDLIDEASSAKKVQRQISKTEKQIQKLTEQLADIQNNKEKAIRQENFQLALELKKQTTEIEEKLNQLLVKHKSTAKKPAEKITNQDIATVIAKMTGIPAEDLLTSEKKKIIHLDKNLNQKIIGQEEAIKLISDHIKRAKAGLTPDQKPLASFIFVGGSGIGKTMTAKILAQHLFGNSKSLIKIDMSEYSEKFNMSKLIGAPAGYVGYQESGQLTEKVKHQPYSVVLFDEIEKANPEIFDLMLQILDDGYLTDATGSKINFTNTMIIMTANIGSEHFKNKENIGFDNELGVSQKLNSVKEKVLADTKNHFKPEFLNRLDKIIYFNPLSLNHLQKITKLELARLNQRLSHKNITLNFNPALVRLVADKSIALNQGARAINKTIQELVETPLAQKLLADEIIDGNVINVDIDGKTKKIKFL